MRTILICLLVISAVHSWKIIENEEHYSSFSAFVAQFGKVYHTEQEVLKRFEIFRNNIKHIFQHMLHDKNAEYGFTEFSDMTPEEFEKQQLTMNMEQPVNLEATENLERRKKSQVDVTKLPKSFDWREKGVVTRVKQQSTCGSCWTFSTTGVIEAQFAIQTGKLVEFSEQQLLDCDTRNDGCSGGLMHKAYKSIREWGGLELASSYGGYQNSKKSCHFNEEKLIADVPNYFMADQDEGSIMHHLVNHGPLAAGVNAKYMQFYQKGVHSHSLCNNGINHAVMIVGYGTDNGTDYWIVKNTWGENWGEKGYFRILRGHGHCGIHTYVSAPHVEVVKKNVNLDSL